MPTCSAATLHRPSSKSWSHWVIALQELNPSVWSKSCPDTGNQAGTAEHWGLSECCQLPLWYLWAFLCVEDRAIGYAYRRRRKTKEMVIRARGKRGKLANPPAPCLDIEQVSSIRILGVTVNQLLSAADHVSSLLASSNSLLYALRVLRVHGIPDESLREVFRATLLAKITYSGPAWHGMCSAGDIAKLESLVKRCRRLG